MCKCPMSNTDVRVPEGVDKVEANQVCPNDCPMLVTTSEEWHKKGGSKSGDVNEVFLKVLNKRCRWSGVDGQVVKAMHVLHLARNMKPAMNGIV